MRRPPSKHECVVCDMTTVRVPRAFPLRRDARLERGVWDGTSGASRATGVPPPCVQLDEGDIPQDLRQCGRYRSRDPRGAHRCDSVATSPPSIAISASFALPNVDWDEACDVRHHTERETRVTRVTNAGRSVMPSACPSNSRERTSTRPRAVQPKCYDYRPTAFRIGACPF